VESRLVRFGALLAGLSVVGSLLVGCQPSSPDEGWGIQQLALDAEYEPRVSMPVTVSADGQSIGFTGPDDGEPTYRPERVPEIFAVDNRPSGPRVLAMTDPAEYPDRAYHTWGGVLSANGQVMVGVGESEQYEAGAPPVDPGESSGSGPQGDCGNQSHIYHPQILRWTRPSRFSGFGDPELVSMEVSETLDCIENGNPVDWWLGARGEGGASSSPSLSADGSVVVFLSTASSLGADPDVRTLLFRDGDDEVGVVTPATWTAEVYEAQISGNGLHVAFVAQDGESDPQVFRSSRTVVGGAWSEPTLISTVAGGLPSDSGSGPGDGNRNVSISGDGTRVSWTSDVVGLEPGMTVDNSTDRVLVVWDGSLATKHLARHRLQEDVAYPIRGEGEPVLSPDGKRIVLTLATNTEPVRHRIVAFDVDRIMAPSEATRMTGVIAARYMEISPASWIGSYGIASAPGNYQAAIAIGQDGPIRRYRTAQPSLYTVGGRVLGNANSRPWHGDPVDASSGVFAHAENDRLGSVQDLNLERSYASNSEELDGLFGLGWSTLYDTSLEFDDLDGSVRVRTPEGRRLTYWPGVSPGTYVTSAGTRRTLTQLLTGYELVEESGRKLLFDLAGRLVGIERPGEPEVVITHPDEPDDPSETLIEFGEGDAWLRLIDDSAWLNDSGWIQVAGVDGRIDRVVSSEGIEVAYEYAQAGPDGTTLLSKASRPYPTGGEPSFGRRFEWTNERLSRIVDQLASDRDHIVVENTYDGLGRVTEQLNATGDVLTFHYGVRWQSDTWVDAADYTTVVNEASGDHISYKYGPGGEVLAVTDPFGLSTASEWQGDQNKSSTSRSGVKVSTAFDAAKRPVTVSETVGGVSRTIASFAYVVGDTAAGAGSDQRLASRTDAAGVTTWFGYDEVASNSATMPHTVAVACDAASLDVGLTCAGSGRSVTTFVYGTGVLADLVVSVTDADGVVTVFDYWEDRTLKSVSTFPDAVTTLVTSHEVVRRGDTGFDESNPAAAWVQVVTDPADAVTETVYGADGQVLEVRDPLFNGTTHLGTVFDYWGNGDLKSITDPAGHTTTYDTLRPGDTGFAALEGLGVDAAEITVVTDADGVSTVTVTDRSGDVVAVAVGDVDEPAALAVTSHSYGPLGRLTATTDPEGVVTRYGYDSEGRLTQTTTGAALGTADRTVTNSFDARGRLMSVSGPVSVDPDDDTVQARQEFAYDSAGRLVARIDGDPADGAARLMTSFHYDTAGRQWRTVEHRGGALDPAALAPAAGDTVTETRFTLAGRTAAVATPPPDQPGFAWLSAPVSERAWTRFDYDDAGRQITVTGPDDTTWTTGYDEAGRVKSRTSPEGRQVGYGYDDAGRLVAVTTPSPTGTGFATTVTTYTPTGLVATQTDPHVPVVGVTDASTRRFAYSDAGRLNTVTDALGNEVTYDYDDRGNRVTRTALDDNDDPVAESWQWDDAGRLIAHVTPAPTATAGPQTTSFDYDPDTGWLDTVTDPTGRVTTYGRYSDGAPRTITHTGPAMATITIEHWRNTRGWTTRSTHNDSTATATTERVFDRAGQPISVTTPAGETLAYNWDLAGNPIGRSDPTGTTAWSHHPGGLVASIARDTGTGPVTAATYSYDDDGLLTAETTAGGGSRTWDHNDAGSVDTYTQVTVRPDTSLDTWTASLTWRHDGRLATETLNTEPTVTYGYDDAGQLTSATDGAGIDLGWEYGTRGNRLATTDGSATTTWATNPNGSVAQAATTTDTVDYDYDLAGRRISASTATATTATSYDAAGRLTAVTDGTTTWGRRYDADGLIAAHVVTTATATVTTEVLSDTVTGPYSHAIGHSTDSTATWTHTVVGPAGPITATGGEFQTDHHGSIIEQPANPAVIDAPTSFDPFGQPDTAVADHQPGYRAEATTAGLIHLRNRDYDPATGQFLTPDPMDGVDATTTVANTHHYTNNDPLNLTDPLGLRARDRELAWGSILAGWEWRDSYEECLSGQGLSRHSDVVPGGGSRWIGPHSDAERRTALVNCAGRGPTQEDIALACGVGGRAGCVLAMLLAHGFPEGRSQEVIDLFCGSLGNFDGLGCATGAALPDGWFDYLLIDLPVALLSGVGFAKLFTLRSTSPTAVATPRTTPGTAIEPLWAQAPNRGFLGGWSQSETIRPGTVLDRYGNDAGRFFSPAGTPFEARALPAGSGPLQRYEVLRPLEVQAGVVAPAFGQPGLGIQYMSSQTVADLIEAGFLKAVG